MTEQPKTAPPCAGTGLCPEAQADGVPCPDLNRDCQTCGRAAPQGPGA